MELMNGKRIKATRTVTQAAYRKLLKLAGENGLLRGGRENFDTHGWDNEDFIETSVWTFNKILQQAYQAGCEDTKKEIAKGGMA